MKKYTRYIAIVLASAIGFSSCAEDASTDRHPEDATIVLTLRMPHEAATRAISVTPGEENRIDAVDVLAFIEKSGDWVYDYTATVTEKTVAGNILTVTARASEMSVPQRFVILANSSSELTAAAPIRGEKIQDIESRLVCSNGNGEWPARLNGTGSFVPFPMYARTGSETINSGNNHIGTSPIISMIRMVARIDVTLNSSITLSNFKLKDACLFNYKKAGYISYANSGFSGTAVTTPAVPSSGDHSGNPIVQPTAFYKADYTNDTRGEILYSIYPFESPAITSEAGKTTGTALVISGFYNGSSTESYYRIDLKTTTDPISSNISSGILRNHSYAVEVKSVTGPGYESALKAYLGGNQLTASVTSWIPVVQTLIADKQFYLDTELDGDGVFMVRNGGTLTVKANTDYNITSQGFPAGIYIDPWEWNPPKASGEWLKYETYPTGSDGSLVREFKLVVDKAKKPADVTEATVKIPVRAGNLTKHINVKLIIEYYPEAHTGWAGSNIYWDGLKLTFDEVGATANRDIQGVYFKWGSLTGISPFGGTYSGSTTLYPPAGGTNSGIAWNSIDRVDDEVIHSSAPDETNRGYLYEITDKDDGVGDICKYLTEQGWAPAGKWRMPTAREFSRTDAPITTPMYLDSYGYVTYNSFSGSGITPTDPTGKEIMPGGKRVTDDSVNTYFPAGGWRNLSGYPSGIGIRGYYWSSTYIPNVGTGAYCLSFFDSGTTLIHNERWGAATIRCVKE